MNKNYVYGGVAVVVVALIALGAWYFTRTGGVWPGNTVPSNQTPGGGQTTQETWRTYENQDLGFSIEYLAKMNVREETDGVLFTLYGATQRTNSVLSDGVSLSVNRVSGVQNVAKYMENDVAEAKKNGTVTKELAATTLDGIQGKMYAAKNGVAYTKIFLPLGFGEVMVVTYSDPDPAGKGYDAVVNRMLNSLRVFEK